MIDGFGQGAMKALNLSLSLGMSHAAVNETDPLLDQVHRKASQSMAIGIAPPRNPMIHQHRLGQALVLEAVSDGGEHSFGTQILQGIQAHGIAAVIIKNR